ncbi:hypothetical protein HYX06_01530 [Candidatus Woesearchaeota archaeon]|nr:hypothetical protein [Candidatus Woesearchaeota archaeon]
MIDKLAMSGILSFDQLAGRLSDLINLDINESDLENLLNRGLFDSQQTIIPGRLGTRGIRNELHDSMVEVWLRQENELIAARACRDPDKTEEITFRRALTALLYLAEHPREGYYYSRNDGYTAQGSKVIARVPHSVLSRICPEMYPLRHFYLREPDPSETMFDMYRRMVLADMPPKISIVNPTQRSET